MFCHQCTIVDDFNKRFAAVYESTRILNQYSAKQCVMTIVYISSKGIIKNVVPYLPPYFTKCYLIGTPLTIDRFMLLWNTGKVFIWPQVISISVGSFVYFFTKRTALSFIVVYMFNISYVIKKFIRVVMNKNKAWKITKQYESCLCNAVLLSEIFHR
jgi:hypothetical protein